MARVSPAQLIDKVILSPLSNAINMHATLALIRQYPCLYQTIETRDRNFKVPSQLFSTLAGISLIKACSLSVTSLRIPLFSLVIDDIIAFR